MKRIAIISLVIGLLACTPLFAAGVTDATKPLGHLKWSVGAEDNFVFDKDFETVADRTKFDLEDINQIYAKAAVGLTPYFNIYGKLGASDGGEIDTVNRDSLLSVKVEMDYGLLWGVGLAGAKEVWEGWKLGADAQFNSSKMDADKVTFNGVSSTGVSGEIENFELQITPFITRKFSIGEWGINPYVGVVVNYFWTQTDSALQYTPTNLGARSENWALKSDDNVGVVLGSDLEVNERFAVVLEGRFVEESAITFGGIYKF